MFNSSDIFAMIARPREMPLIAKSLDAVLANENPHVAKLASLCFVN